MGRADLHLHTRRSDGFPTVDQLLDHVEERTDLDVIAVTDHEDVAAGLQARETAARRRLRFDVVPGVEVTTRRGHLLALFVEASPPFFRSVESTLEWIHARGGLAVVPHPMSWLTWSLGRRTLERVMRENDPAVRFDAIETGNPSPAGRIVADRVVILNRRWRLPETGGSDAHHLVQVGTGWTVFPGRGASDLRRALESGEVAAEMRRYPSLREVGLRRVAAGLLWGYMATPRNVISRGTARWRRR